MKLSCSVEDGMLEIPSLLVFCIHDIRWNQFIVMLSIITITTKFIVSKMGYITVENQTGFLKRVLNLFGRRFLKYHKTFTYHFISCIVILLNQNKKYNEEKNRKWKWKCQLLLHKMWVKGDEIERWEWEEMTRICQLWILKR